MITDAELRDFKIAGILPREWAGDTLIDLAQYLAAELLQRREAERWISAVEKYPPEYKTVLVARVGMPYAIMAFWTGEKWSNNVDHDDYYVTIWRDIPLPPPPEEVSHE